MSTTKTLKVNQNFDRLLKCRANGYYDYIDVVIPTKDTKNINVEMQNYDGLKYTWNSNGTGTAIIDFSDTVLPWKFEMNNYLARTRYCLKPYSETPYQVEILEPKYKYIENVGGVTDNGGIFSGFSGTKCVKLIEKFNQNYAWSVIIKINCIGLSLSSTILGYYGSGLFKISLGSDNRLALSLSTNNYSWAIGEIFSTNAIELNKDYWVKAEFTGSEYNLYLSDNGNYYDLIGTINSSDIFVMPDELVFGNGVNTVDDYGFNGIIDLNETFITGYFLVDGQYVEQTRKMTDANYIKQWNLNKVGNVQVSDDGIISNFSSSNYASINDVHINTSEDLILKFTTGDNISTHQNIFTSNYDLYIAYGNLCNWNEGAVRDEIVFRGVQANTTYWIKYSVNADKEVTVGVSLNGVDYEYTTYTNTTINFSDNANMDLGIFTGNTSNYFKGSIDFANSSIPRSSGKTITEELHGIIDDTDFSILKPIYCYANRDERVVLRNTETENFDTSDWYLGEFKFFDVDIELQPDLDV